MECAVPISDDITGTAKLANADNLSTGAAVATGTTSDRKENASSDAAFSLPLVRKNNH